jgi:hypothetical protein
VSLFTKFASGIVTHCAFAGINWKHKINIRSKCFFMIDDFISNVVILIIHSKRLQLNLLFAFKFEQLFASDSTCKA